MEVVACVLKKQQKILISNRPPDKDFSGFYEFPGGKVQIGEYMLEALRREIFEELGVNIKLNKTYYLKSFRISQNTKKISLNFFICLGWTGKIINKEKQEIEWILPAQFNKYDFLKSNKEFIKYLSSFIFPPTN